MHKKIFYIIVLSLFVVSCGDTMKSVKRGLTGEKADSTDEFLVKKKAPLILPPDFENLPTPDERIEAEEEFFVLEKELEATIEQNSSQPSTVESSILKKIQSK